MNSKTTIGLVILTLGFLTTCWIFNATRFYWNSPSPFEFWDNYGFEVGQKYIVRPANTDPFRSDFKIDTLTVTNIIDGYVQFSDNSSIQISYDGLLHNSYTEYAPPMMRNSRK